MTLLVGIFFGGIVSLIFWFQEKANDANNNNYNVEQEVEQDLANSILSFPTKVFFLALLPPILFQSGYQSQRELFLRHFAPISLFACAGTVISGLVGGGILLLTRHWFTDDVFDPTVMELLTFGSMIAATDTVSVVGILQAKQVDPHLFSLVFGESALNDAVTLVLFKTFSTFLINGAFGDAGSWWMEGMQFLLHLMIQATCSPFLGMLYCIVMATLFRIVDLRQHSILELSLYIMPMYVPFMLSEALELSGMITIFFTGMFAKRYIEPNVSQSTRQHAQVLFQVTSFLAETGIFLELGLSFFGLSGKFHWKFIGITIGAALIGRAMSIYPLAALYNVSLTKVVQVVVVKCGGSVTTRMYCGSDNACGNDNTMEDVSISTIGTTSVGAGGGVGSLPSTTTTNTLNTHTTTTTMSRRQTPSRRLDKRIPLSFMHMLTFAGLRGAFAYACARDFPNLYGNRDIFVSTTMAVVLFTVVIMGGATLPLMERLGIATGVDEAQYMKEWRQQRKPKGWWHRMERRLIYPLAIRPPDDRNEESYANVTYGEGGIHNCTTFPHNNVHTGTNYNYNSTSMNHHDDAFGYAHMVDGSMMDEGTNTSGLQLMATAKAQSEQWASQRRQSYHGPPTDTVASHYHQYPQHHPQLWTTSPTFVEPQHHPIQREDRSLPHTNSLPMTHHDDMDETNVFNFEGLMHSHMIRRQEVESQTNSSDDIVVRVRHHSIGDENVI